MNATKHQVVSTLLPGELDLHGNLLFYSRAGLDNGYYLWDLSIGSINHIGSYGILPSGSKMNYFVNPQQYIANGWEKVDAYNFQGYTMPSDVGFNFKDLTF